jgi:hypothetical protein
MKLMESRMASLMAHQTVSPRVAIVSSLVEVVVAAETNDDCLLEFFTGMITVQSTAVNAISTSASVFFVQAIFLILYYKRDERKSELSCGCGRKTNIGVDRATSIRHSYITNIRRHLVRVYSIK